MAELETSIAAGTAAVLLATALLLVRLDINGRRPVLALVRRWSAAGAWSSALVVTLLLAIAVYCFDRVAAHQASYARDARSGGASAAISHPVPVADASSGADPWQALSEYASKIDQGGSRTANAQSPAPTSRDALPDVDTMIANLAARLDASPNDVKGWKMLGWSYLNMDRPADAATAYERALKLDPADAEIAKGLAAAKAAQAAK